MNGWECKGTVSGVSADIAFYAQCERRGERERVRQTDTCEAHGMLEV